VEQFLVSLLASEITTTTLVEEGEDRLMTALTLVCLVCSETTTTTMDVTVVEGGGEMLLALMRLVSGSLVWKAFSVVVVEVTVAVTVADPIKDSPNGMVGAKEDPTRVGTKEDPTRDGTKEDPTRDGTKEDSLRAVANVIIS